MEKERTAGKGPPGGPEAAMSELSCLVRAQIRSSSWWDRYGADWLGLCTGLALLLPGVWLLQAGGVLGALSGCLCLGITHTLLAVKGAHLASHGALAQSQPWRKLCSLFFIEVCGMLPVERGVATHVKLHHGHTNILGLGDSSTWRMPFLSRFLYLFIAPLSLPIITPFVCLGYLRGERLTLALRTVCLASLGFIAHYWMLRWVAGLQSPIYVLACMFVSRNICSLPLIHINIFQHIGLPMFSPESRPPRLVQMAHAVLNLSGCSILDWVFGHGLVSCHVEHHLFPSLSDNMCRQIKPLVSTFLKSKGLPYQEDSYGSRLRLFYDNYDDLMIHAPPITELGHRATWQERKRGAEL
uniref:Fatty acid desaturase 6 n=1 Tax=Eptatretus burgeri TaxID=7764 RepID=A0A8C4QB36_EPTBU